MAEATIHLSPDASARTMARRIWCAVVLRKQPLQKSANSLRSNWPIPPRRRIDLQAIWPFARIAYRLCEPLGGVHAISGGAGLRAAFQELVTPGPNPARISQIGFRWGFSDEASFSRAFRAMYGLSPSEARAEGYVHYARIAFGESGNPAGESELSKWIRDLMKR